jgi:phosphate transport system permease protein
MSTATDLPPAPETRQSLSLTQAKLPLWAPILVGVLSLAVGALLAVLFGWGIVAAVVLAGLVFTVALPAWSFVVENRRAAVDRLMTTLVWGTCVVAVVPLVWVLYIVIAQGLDSISIDFLTNDSHNPLSPDVGIAHALVGTLLVTFIAALISVPIGIMTAIFLVEYGKRSRLAHAITFLVDVMTGIPSIVAGLFALSLFVLILGPAIRFGLGGAVALSLLMVPIVVRSTEEMLRLVPDDLREASYALGIPKWRTIVKVVLPTSLGGIITGVTLAVARVIGETAPLLVVCGATNTMNLNPFSGRMMTLPVYIFYSFTQPGVVPRTAPPGTDPPGIARAWAASLVLIVLVLLLNLVARIIGKIFAVPTK